MDPVLQSLIRYQELSLELSRRKSRLEGYPALLKAIDDELEAAAASLARARAAVTDHQKERRRLEMELQDLEAKARKYNEQLMQVKTNTEYKAMQAEIGGVKEKIGGVEEKILILMDEAESAERRVKDEEKVHEGRRRDAESRKTAVRQEESQLAAEAAAVEASQKEARAGLPPDVVDVFSRIAATRGGVAVARAREERCQGCNVRIRPQIYQEIKRNDRIIQCDSCRRILYWVEEAPAAAAQAGPAPAPDSAEAEAAPAAVPDAAAPDDASSPGGTPA